MPRYLLEVSYSKAGMEGLRSGGGTARRDAVAKMLAEVGGSLVTFDFSFGKNDVVLIVDAPDNQSVAAITMMVGASGAATCRTTPLLSPEEIDRAAQAKAIYRPPGS
jgi:uncharacterized protein with GYD domain